MNKKILLLPISMVALTACGFSLKEVYRGDEYNDSVFENNYYDVWDEELKKVSESVADEIVMNDKEDTYHVFKSFNDNNLKILEKNYEKYDYVSDKNYWQEPAEGKLSYGKEIALSKVDNSFKYGMISKLFDGQLFCNGKYQQARIQVRANENNVNGFATRFIKEGYYGDYLMMNFKGATVGKDGKDVSLHSISFSIDLHLNLFYKDDNLIKKQKITYNDLLVNSNIGDTHSRYTCFGFGLNELDIPNERLVGISFDYDVKKDGVIDDYQNAIFLYEISFVNSIWH